MSKKWNGKRIAYIDVAKGIGIILVVCGHIIAEGNKPFKYSNIIHGYIYSFHIALFFIISGILIGTQIEDKVELEYIKNRTHSCIQNLMVPYFLWSAIYFILDNKSLSHDIYEWLLCTVTFLGRAPIWFLIALFWADIFAIDIIYIAKRKKNVVIVTIIIFILSITFWKYYRQLSISSIIVKYSMISLFRGLVCLLFVLVGYIASSTIIRNENKFIIGIKLCISSLISFGTYVLFRTENNLHTFSIENIYVFLVTGISGSCMILFFCKFICEIINMKSLEWIGQHSLGIMCIHYTHLPFMQYATDICNHMGLDGGVIAFIISFAFVFSSSILGIKVLKKISCRI